MKTGIKAQTGQPTGKLSCCGQPMRHIEAGIYECSGCDCWVTSDDGVITTVGRCDSH